MPEIAGTEAAVEQLQRSLFDALVVASAAGVHPFDIYLAAALTAQFAEQKLKAFAAAMPLRE